MTQLVVVLEEGFDGDAVTVHVGDHVVFTADAVTTRPQVGYAQRITVDADVPATVTVDVPRRGLASHVQMPARAGMHLGISLDDDQLTHRMSDEPFRYA